MKGYEIITDSDYEKVNGEVNRHLALGAEAIGGISTVITSGGTIYYSQAIAYPS